MDKHIFFRFVLSVLFWLSVPLCAAEKFHETPWERNLNQDSAYIVQDAVVETTFELPKSPAEEEPKEKKEETVAEADSIPHSPPPIPVEKMYRLNIGDKLNISIYGEPNTMRQVTVDSSGHIYYLYVDSIFVLGMTIDELKKILNEKIKVQFKHAFVSVSAENVGGEYYTIMGEVIEPGQKVLHGKENLLMALGYAGGMKRGPFRNQTVDYADLHRAFLTRRGKYIPVDFHRLVIGGDLSQNVLLANGDYIFIPAKMTMSVYVLGEVFYPSTLSYLNSISLVEAITDAGGVTEIASSRIVILRGSLTCPTHYEVDFNSILRRCCPDFMLEPGDIVYVPPRRFQLLREIVRNAIQTFVSVMASVAGTESFLSVNPGARGNVIAPVNVITTGTTIGTTPVIVAP